MFDPNQPLPNFQAQNEQLQQARAYAQQLRQGAMQDQPQGQMVSGHYVAPHWGTRLAHLLRQYMAGDADRKATAAADKYTAGVNEAQSAWQAGMPQGTPAVPGRPELMGPAEEQGSPELQAIPAQPARPPSREAVLKHTLAGMQIPGNAPAAQLFHQSLSKDIEREDTQEDKRETRRETLAQQARQHAESLAQKVEAARLRSEDTRLSIEQRAEAARLMAEARREHSQAMQAIAAMKAQGKSGGGKPLPSTQSKSWIENNSALRKIHSAFDAVDAHPKAFGFQNILGDEVNQRLDPKGVEARALVDNIGSLVIHQRSGAAVSVKEFERLKAFIPNSKDTPETVRKKLALFEQEYMNIQQEILDYAETQDYKSPGQTPVRVKKDKEGKPIPSEAQTIDGVEYVKIGNEWFRK